MGKEGEGGAGCQLGCVWQRFSVERESICSPLYCTFLEAETKVNVPSVICLRLLSPFNYYLSLSFPFSFLSLYFPVSFLSQIR